ncbi:MAG: RNA methyltransferase [Mycobacteriales bacterium]
MTVQLEGFHAVKHALRFAPELVDAITVADLDATRALAGRLAPDISDALLARARVGGVPHPTGVQAQARRPADDRSVLATRRTPLVLLDEPRHPGNAGAVIRVAAAAGASGVAVIGTLDPWHQAVIRGSAGLHYALPVLSAAAEQMTGPWLVLDADGDDLRSVPDDAVLVVGSERAGVGPQLRRRADAVVRLPMRAGVSSLNLATATAAALYLWRLDVLRDTPRPAERRDGR